MRLIDADAWVDAHCEGCEYKDGHFCSPEDPVCGAVETMNEAPTIDAVEVVRCKVCEHRRKATVNRKGFLICPASGMEITENDFCSYGERKNDDKRTDSTDPA